MHENDRMSALIKAALIQSQFEMIHPFLDENGSVGRLLIAFYLANAILVKVHKTKPTGLL